jgi:hypothetical protein
MCHAFLRDARFWLALLAIDRDIAEEARKERCRRCGGPLHCAHYRRKPRGVEPGGLSVECLYRLSFSCGACRRRLTPPSVRFLGRKVYLGAVVVLVTAMRQGPTPTGSLRLRELFGADRRTIARWQEFWREIFPATKFWRLGKARFMPPVEEGELPRSLLEAFAGSALAARLKAALRFLAPITIPGGLTVLAR